jgi:hypothetical protein
MSTSIIGKVVSSTAGSIVVEIENAKHFETHKSQLTIGRYLKIADGNSDFIVSMIKSVRAKEGSSQTDNIIDAKFVIDTQPIGVFSDGEFNIGVHTLPLPLEDVMTVEKELLDTVFAKNSIFNFNMGHLLQNKDVQLYVNGNSFFGKHIGVVGSTGSGKSCAVAKILQTALSIEAEKNKNIDKQTNSHIVIFDIHSEYKKAFTLEDDQKFNLNYLNVSTMKLPYWLMNSEELEDLFVEGGDRTFHNQISIFKEAIILNKELHNPTLSYVDYDTPVYFSLTEIANFINNHDKATKDATTYELAFDGVENPNNETMFGNVKFKPKATGKINAGPFAGELTRFSSRFQTILNDKRLKFITEPNKSTGEPIKTEDFVDVLKQLIGYSNKSNVTIIDLSGVPFEVLSITVSLISRIIFDFCFYYSKMKHEAKGNNDNPILVVFEEAHNYIPKNNEVSYKAAKRSVERIAKEGRKYGLSSMVVSQRPSEVSETIFSQCNNFVALRLTNPNDQNYIKNLLPENIEGLGDILPTLGKGQCLIVGDSLPMATLAQLDLPSPRPASDDVAVLDMWQKDWLDITFADVISKWQKTD